MQMKSDCDLESCFLCQLCLPEWIPAVAANKTTIRVKKGTRLFAEGDPAEGIWFVNSGTIKVHKKWDADKELIIRFAQRGDILGIMGLGDERLLPVTATALEESSVCYIDLKFFESTLKINGDLTYRLLMLFAHELRESEKRMRNLAHMPVKGRIEQALINLKRQFNTDAEGYIGIELTRQDLASYAGATYETLFRMLTEMSNEGLVSLNGKRIKLIQSGAGTLHHNLS